MSSDFTIAAAELSHETNTFSSVKTDLRAFQRAGLRRGSEIRPALRDSATSFAGFFDGADKLNAVPTPRGLRVLFSKKGQTADDLVRALVRAEPPGRPVAVISSDREVADGVRRHGAYPLSADTLLRRIARS